MLLRIVGSRFVRQKQILRAGSTAMTCTLEVGGRSYQTDQQRRTCVASIVDLYIIKVELRADDGEVDIHKLCVSVHTIMYFYNILQA